MQKGECKSLAFMQKESLLAKKIPFIRKLKHQKCKYTHLQL